MELLEVSAQSILFRRWGLDCFAVRRLSFIIEETMRWSELTEENAEDAVFPFFSKMDIIYLCSGSIRIPQCPQLVITLLERKRKRDYILP